MRILLTAALILMTNCAPKASKEVSKLDGHWYSNCTTINNSFSKKTELTIKLGRLFTFDAITYENDDCSEKRYSVFTKAYSFEGKQVDSETIDGKLKAGGKKEILLVSKKAAEKYNEQDVFGSDNWTTETPVDVSAKYQQKDLSIRVMTKDDMILINDLTFRRAP